MNAKKGNNALLGPNGTKLENSDALYENAKELARRAELTKVPEDIGKAEKAMEIAQSREYQERYENKTKEPEKLTESEILQKKLHAVTNQNDVKELNYMNPSDSPVIPQRIEAEKPSIPEVAAQSISSVKQDIKILQDKMENESYAVSTDVGKIENGNGDVTGTGKKEGNPNPEPSEDAPMMGGSLAMPSKPAVSNTFKWWMENGIDHKYNREMQSRLNLKPSGKLTHGGEIKDNEDGVKKIKQQGKEAFGSEMAQGQKGAVFDAKKKGPMDAIKKAAEDAKKQAPFKF